MTSPDLPDLQPDMPPDMPPDPALTVQRDPGADVSMRPIIDTEHLALWLGPTTPPQTTSEATAHAAPHSSGSMASIVSDRASALPTQSLSNLSLRVMPGDRISLTGPSGAGKSVLLRSLALLDKPLSGAVRYRGEPVMAAIVPTYRSAVAYLMQRASLPGETVRDALEQPFRLHAHRERRFDETMAVTLFERAGKSAGFLDKTNANLSGGEAQIAALVRTLLLAPDVLLLDEPTAALDPASAAAVEALIDHWYQPSRAFIWISHDLQQAERIAAIHWRVADGQLHLA